MLKKLMNKKVEEKPTVSRREFLTHAAATTGAAIAAFPMFASAQEKKAMDKKAADTKAPAAPAVVSSAA